MCLECGHSCLRYDTVMMHSSLVAVHELDEDVTVVINAVDHSANVNALKIKHG